MLTDSVILPLRFTWLVVCSVNLRLCKFVVKYCLRPFTSSAPLYTTASAEGTKHDMEISLGRSIFSPASFRSWVFSVSGNAPSVSCSVREADDAINPVWSFYNVHAIAPAVNRRRFIRGHLRLPMPAAASQKQLNMTAVSSVDAMFWDSGNHRFLSRRCHRSISHNA